MVGSGGDAAKVTELHLILGVQQQVLQLHVSEKTNYVITLVIILCTGGAHYLPNSFLFISNKFCNGGKRPEQGD
jgi:hypothetical protein